MFPVDISFHVLERESEDANVFMWNRVEFFKQVQEKLQERNMKYKQSTNEKKHKKVFAKGDLVWVYVNKDHYPIGEYNKPKPWKIGPCKILRCINDNAYEVELPE